MAPCTTPLCQFQMIGSPLPTIAKFHQIQDKDKRQKDSKEGPPGNPPCRVHALCRASCPHTIIADFTSTALFLQCAPPKPAAHRLGRGNKRRLSYCPLFPPRATTAVSYFFCCFASRVAFAPSHPHPRISLSSLLFSSVRVFLIDLLPGHPSWPIMASPAVKKAITEAALNYQKPEGTVFQYGTAGVSGRKPWFF